MASKFNKSDYQFTSALQSTARLLGIKFLDHLVLGSADCEDGRGYVSIVDCLEEWLWHSIWAG